LVPPVQPVGPQAIVIVVPVAAEYTSTVLASPGAACHAALTLVANGHVVCGPAVTPFPQ
jgi:hypothetical protein